MSPDLFVRVGLDPGLLLLPMAMDTHEARAMILAVFLQETGLAKRRQLGGGPARGYGEFETAGIRGVLKHPRVAAQLRAVCTAIDIAGNYNAIHRAIEFHDPLMVVLSRLLLWTLPEALPARGDVDASWKYYERLWRPGKPHMEFWRGNFEHAWSVIDGA